MANELLLSIAASFSKGGRTADTRNMGASGVFIDVSGTDFFHGTQTIGTSPEAIDLGDITTPGYIVIKNRDATNFVEIRDGSGGADVVKLLAGDVQCFRLATSTPFAVADTASCEIEYLLVEA